MLSRVAKFLSVTSTRQGRKLSDCPEVRLYWHLGFISGHVIAIHVRHDPRPSPISFNAVPHPHAHRTNRVGSCMYLTTNADRPYLRCGRARRDGVSLQSICHRTTSGRIVSAGRWRVHHHVPNRRRQRRHHRRDVHRSSCRRTGQHDRVSGPADLTDDGCRFAHHGVGGYRRRRVRRRRGLHAVVEAGIFVEGVGRLEGDVQGNIADFMQRIGSSRGDAERHRRDVEVRGDHHRAPARGRKRRVLSVGGRDDLSGLPVHAEKKGA